MISIPSDRYPWLTSESLENILNTSGLVNVKVSEFELYGAVAKGENYGSQMIRALVTYNSDGDNSRQKSLIIKTTLNMDCLIQFEKTLTDAFEREVVFYRDIQPKFKKYQDMIEPNFKCAPRCYRVRANPFYFVFEDLRDAGYCNMNRRVGLDFNATSMLVRKLAKLHALNAMVYEESPELFARYHRPLISPEHTEVILPNTRGLRDCQVLCRNWPGYEHFAGKIQNFLENIVTKVGAAYDNSEKNVFRTLTHGDLWVNNVMYKFNVVHEPIDVIMVDYQIGYYGSPLLDLSYLFYTSTVNEIGEFEWDRLLQIYHSELVGSLQAVKYSKRIPTLNDLQIEMLKRSAYAVMMAFTIIPPRQMENCDDATVELLLTDSDKTLKLRHSLFDKPGVKERVQYMMDYFDRKGFFE